MITRVSSPIFTHWSYIWFFLKNDNLGLEMKILKFLEIQPRHTDFLLANDNQFPTRAWTETVLAGLVFCSISASNAPKHQSSFWTWSLYVPGLRPEWLENPSQWDFEVLCNINRVSNVNSEMGLRHLETLIIGLTLFQYYHQ